MTDEPDGMDAAAVDWQEEYEGWLNEQLNEEYTEGMSDGHWNT